MQRLSHGWSVLPTLLVALAVSGCGDASAPPFALLLTVDTLRFDTLSAYGGQQGLTPTLDALAEESVLFEYCYAPAPFTLASVAALHTGRHPESIGVTSNKVVLPRGPATLAGQLSRAGWITAAAVSNYILRPDAGLARGFDHYDASFPQLEAVRGMAERIAPRTTAAALEILDLLLEQAPKPIFLWVHYQDPHGPYTPPDDYRDRYLETEAARDARRVPAGRGSRGLGTIPRYQHIDGRDDVAFYRAGYAGEVRYLDDHLGVLFEGLRERGLWDDAAIVFAADHGEALGERGYWFAHGEFLHDPLVRVPCLVRFPGVEPERREGPAALVDLAPTLLSQLGVPVPEDVAGVDLLAEGSQLRERAIPLATLEESLVPRRGLVWRGWKYLVQEGGQTPREELHPMGDESRNRVLQNPRVLERMREAFRASRSRLRNSPKPQLQELSEGERERLRALGYGVDEAS